MDLEIATTKTPITPQLCGDTNLEIRKDGTWFHEGGAIARKELVCLFASVLQRDEFGEYWLKTPMEQTRIMVEDAPFMAVELFAVGSGEEQSLSLRTNIDEVISVGLDNPIRVEHDPVSEEPSPYVVVRAGKGLFPIEAKINRSVFYELVNRGEEQTIDGEVYFGIWSNKEFFPLGQLQDD